MCGNYWAKGNGSDLPEFQDNQLEIRIPVSVTSDWRVTGTSKPSHVEYNITQQKVDKYIVEDLLGKIARSLT